MKGDNESCGLVLVRTGGQLCLVLGKSKGGRQRCASCPPPVCMGAGGALAARYTD